MVKTLLVNNPAMKVKIFTFGQAGNRIGDVFAGFKTSEGEVAYQCYALNSNTGDMKELKYIPEANRLSLELGGLGKNPEKAMEILKGDEVVREKMKSFITSKVNDDDDMVLFIAGLGGGTGTSTIVETLENFHKEYNLPKLEDALLELIRSEGLEKYKANPGSFNKRALEAAKEKYVKIGVIAVLPRLEGPDVLRQTQVFAQKLWDMANDETKGISFAHFPDNEHLSNKFKSLSAEQKKKYETYRDYANHEIAETFHEVNVMADLGGTSVVLDKADLKRTLTEGKGCLVISKVSEIITKEYRKSDVAKLFDKALEKGNLHEMIKLREGGKVRKVHHVCLLAALDQRSKLGGSGAFLDEAVEKLNEDLPIQGTIFSGFVECQNENNASAYLIFKVAALPGRLEKGLVEEYQRYTEKINSTEFADNAKIQAIEVAKEEETSELTLADLGLGNLFGIDQPEEAPKKDEKEMSKEELRELMKKELFKF